MNYLMSGGMNPEKLDLLISLTSFRSEDVIAAIKDHLINGAPVEVAAAGQLTDSANLTRALKKLNDVAAKVERCKEIDLYGKADRVKTVSKVTDHPTIEITQEAYSALRSSKFDDASAAILAAMPKKKAKFDPLQGVPSGINFQAWSSWVLFRKERRKAVSKRAASMQLKMLLGYDHATQELIINSSIQNDYQGLFEPKGGAYGQNQPARISHAQRSAGDTEQLLSLANSIENGHGSMGANGPALPQHVDGCGGPSGGEWRPVEEFQLVAEEDGTFVARGICAGDGTL